VAPKLLTSRIGRVLAAALGVLIASAMALAVPGSAGVVAKTRRMSLSSSGAQGNDSSFRASISADGRFVAFESRATNLVSGDTNGQQDVFVRDRKTGKTKRVSVSSSGAQGNDSSFEPSISADGRFVVFGSNATNLVGGDSNGQQDVFVRDLKTSKTKRVSVSSTGAQGNGQSFDPSISADGRLVAFASGATNLVGADTNGQDDIFVHDLKAHTTKRVSVSSSGVQGNSSSFSPSISAGGRFVAFTSNAANLVGGDSSGQEDVFVRDRKTGKTKRVSVSSSGAQGNGASFTPSLSATGRFVVYASVATNLVGADTNGFVDVFMRDRKTGKTKRVSVSSSGAQANGSSFLLDPLVVSTDGRFVAFISAATNLAGHDTNGVGDDFVRDLKHHTTKRVSVSSSGAQGNGFSVDPTITPDGHFVAFAAAATNLVGGDTNGFEDIFVRGPLR
jgi:WD40-like Beta Propeller Repeat